MSTWGAIGAPEFRRRVFAMRRSRPHYKPCLLLAALDLMDRGSAYPSHVPLGPLLAEYQARLAASGLEGHAAAFMPAWHLAVVSETAQPFWDLVKAGMPMRGPKPGTTEALLRRADSVRFVTDLHSELDDETGRLFARMAILELLEHDASSEAQQLFSAWPRERSEMLDADRALERREAEPFVLDDPDAALATSSRAAIVRSCRFSPRVIDLYRYRCSLCRTRLHWNGLGDIQAAHIKPRSLHGIDDARNGLALCASHHWAFDKFFWTVTDDLTIRLQRSHVQRGDDLSALEAVVNAVGGVLTPPGDHRLRPHPLALRWHRERFEAQLDG